MLSEDRKLQKAFFYAKIFLKLLKPVEQLSRL